MPFLSPAKLLVILVIALVVLGPDKLPRVAKQIGSLWGDVRKFRDKLESEVRGNFPDLPSTDSITKAVRAPLTFLDDLAGTRSSESEPTSGGRTRPSDVGGDVEIDPPSRTDRPAGAGQTSAVLTSSAPPRSAGAPGVSPHRIRVNGEVGSDDPGMN